MHRRPPKSTRNDTLFPYTTRCRSTNGEERDQTSAPCQIANLWQVRLMNSDVSTIARRVRGQADALPDLFGRFDFDKAPERWAPEADAVSELGRSEEHTSELQSLMRISYAVFCLKKKK